MRIHLYTDWDSIENQYDKGNSFVAWSKKQSTKEDIHIDIHRSEIIEKRANGYFLVQGRDLYGYD